MFHGIKIWLRRDLLINARLLSSDNICEGMCIDVGLEKREGKRQRKRDGERDGKSEGKEGDWGVAGGSRGV